MRYHSDPACHVQFAPNSPVVFARFMGSGGMNVADARAGTMQTASIAAAKAIEIALLHPFFRTPLLTFIVHHRPRFQSGGLACPLLLSNHVRCCHVRCCVWVPRISPSSRYSDSISALARIGNKYSYRQPYMRGVRRASADLWGFAFLAPAPQKYMLG